MKISFVYPRFEKFLYNTPEFDKGLADYFLGDFTTPPSLGIPILASYTPPDIEVELLDDNSGDVIDYNAPTDLVAINCFTPQATRAFEIADRFRAAGKLVIMGGFFPSFMVDECLQHADAVNIGEGEPTWPQIIEDARSGRLKRIYKGGYHSDVTKLKVPKRDIFYHKTSYDWDEDLVQLTRGCSYTCGMCAIPAHMGSRIRFRPIDQVVSEIKSLKYENVYLADDTLFFQQRKMIDYATELLTALIPLNKKYFVASTMALNTDDAFLDLMARAGVRNFYCTMNVDPVSIKALSGDKATQQQLVDLVKKLEDRQIRFFGSCGLGRDWDDTTIAERIVSLFDKANIHTAEFFIFTPYPGSVHWERMERQQRIVDRTWKHYNGAHVVFKPMGMSAEELYGQFVKVWNDFYRLQKGAHVAHLEPSTYQGGKQIVGKPLQRSGVNGQAAITGIGVLTPIGNDTETMVANLRAGKHGLGPITRFDTSHFRTNFGGEVRNFNPADFLSAAEIAAYDDRYLQMAITAARKALKDSGLPYQSEAQKPGEAHRWALVLGTCNGGLLSAEEEYKWINGKSSKPFSEKMNLMAQYYGFGAALAQALGIDGDVWIVTTACSSTTGALGLAQTLINRGYYKTVLVGGSDALCVANMAGFDGLKATAQGQTAPFSEPIGLNIGEASVFWVVEEMEAALLRQARVYGRIVGHALTSDAYHPTTPDPRGDGVFRTLRNALADAGLAVGDIGCINAHGTGTEANDKAETKGIAKLIGEHKIPAVSTKSFVGHCMGSAGIVEATANLLSMNNNFIPPTVNFSQSRGGCTLDYVPNNAREQEYSAFVSANYAFGGNNAAVVIVDGSRLISKRAIAPQRVVITGAGAVSSLGLTIDTTLKALREGRSGIGPVERLGTMVDKLRSKRGGLVAPFKPADIDRRLDFSGMSPISMFATVAAHGALAHGGLRVSPKNAESAGVVMGVCNGTPESDHMNSVFSSPNYAADVASFSNIVPNAVAGWVSNALCLKGVNCTVAPGPHSGMQSLAYVFDTLMENRSAAMVAAAADELYAQTYYNYDLIEWLYSGVDEEEYRLRFDHDRRKIMGEGAAALLCETLEAATARNATILGELLSYGMAMDNAPLGTQHLDRAGAIAAIDCALQRGNVDKSEIDCIVWAPQGNSQDQKALDAIAAVFGERAATLPLITTTFHTGYIESASILLTLGALLRALPHGANLWNPRTGDQSIDNRTLRDMPRIVLTVATTDLGYNFAALVRPGAVQ